MTGQEDDSFQGRGPMKASSLQVAMYRDWCEANDYSPVRLSSLDAYATNLSDADYFHLARQIQAWEFEHKPKTPKGQGKSKLKDVTAGQHDVDPHQPWKNTMADDPYFGLQDTPDFADIPLGGDDYRGEHRAEDFRGPITPGEDAGIARNPYTGDTETGRFKGNPEGHGHWDKESARDPMRAYINWCQANQLKKISARNVAYFAGNDTQLCYHLALRMKRAIHTARLRRAEDTMRHEGESGEQLPLPDMSFSGFSSNPNPEITVPSRAELQALLALARTSSARTEEPGRREPGQELQPRRAARSPIWTTMRGSTGGRARRIALSGRVPAAVPQPRTTCRRPTMP